jgi:hypothetical protein
MDPPLILHVVCHVNKIKPGAPPIPPISDKEMGQISPMVAKPSWIDLQEFAQAIEIDNVGDRIILIWILQMNHSLHTSIMNRMAMAAT